MRDWENIFTCANWGIVIGSADGKTLELVNPAFARMHGYTVDELTGRPIIDVFAAEVRVEIPTYIELAHLRGHYRCESLHLHRDGRIFPVLIDITTVRDATDVILYRIINVQDISEQKSVESALRRNQEQLRISQEFFQNTFDYAAVGMAICDLAGRYLQVNPVMCQLVGYTEEELLALTYRDVTHADDVEENENLRHRVLLHEIDAFQMEKRYVRKDGTIIWALMVVSLVADAQGKPLYTIGQMLNIDSQKQTELALLESRRQLRALSARHESLIEDERKHIAREIHDELGQLLTVLKMDIALLQLDLSGQKSLQSKTEQMRLLVEQMIQVTRDVASNLRPAALDLGLVAAIEWLAEDVGRRVEIAISVASEFSDIELDDNQATTVFRVVQESLTNVVRHANASAVMISLRCVDAHLHVCIEDDGSGFDLSPVDARQGLGIFGMRERVLMLGGNLNIATAIGIGTTIEIDLPLTNK